MPKATQQVRIWDGLCLPSFPDGIARPVPSACWEPLTKSKEAHMLLATCDVAQA